MKKIKDMKLEEIMKNIGCFVLTNADVNNIAYDDSQLRNELTEKLHKELYGVEDIDTKANILRKFVLDNERYIDKESYTLMQLYRLTETTNKNMRIQLRQQIENCKKLLKESNSRKSICILERDKKNGDRLEVINLKRLLGKNNESKNKDKLEELDEKVGIKSIIVNITSNDIEKYAFTETSLGKRLPIIVAGNTIMENEKEANSLGYFEPESIQKCINEKYRKEYLENMQKALYKYSEYLNMDKLLLIFSYRLLENIEDGTLNKNIAAYKVILDETKEMIENPKAKIKISEEDDEKEFSIKELQKELDKFEGNTYVGKNRIENIKQNILEKGDSFYNYTPFEIYSINLSGEEIFKAMENIENVRYLLEYQMMGEELIEQLPNIIKDWPSDLIDIMYENDIINTENMIDMYMEGRLNIENIQDLKNEHEEELQELISEEEIIEIYKVYKEMPKDENTEQLLNKCVLLYKELKLKGIDKEDKIKIGTKLIEELNEDFEENDLKELYKLGLIEIETAVEWGGESITKEMLIDRTLKPSDAKRLIKENQIDINYIIRLLQSKDLSEEEKLTLICSTFSDDDQMALRMELMQYLNIKEEKNYSKKENTNVVAKNKNANSEKRKKYMMDPGARWKLMTLLDKEYTQTLTNDGHIIFQLPNIDNGIAIIEKMFKRTKEGTKPSYGSATYIMTQEEFINNRSQIIEETSKNQIKINREKLLEMKVDEKTDKIVHSKGWGRHIKQYFNIEEESKYSKKQIEEIDKAIESIEKSRVLD